MIFNRSYKIKADEGDYIVLTDYGCEGFSVTYQLETLEEALHSIAESDCGSPQVLLKLVRIEAKEVDTEKPEA